MATVLTAVPINRRKLTRRLARAGYDAMAGGYRLRVPQDGDWGEVDTATTDLAELSDSVLSAARQLLGFRPRDGITCRFYRQPGESLQWATVIDIARAVAADTPLAVLDDHAGTTYLVHPGRGLIGPGEYRNVPSRPSTAELLRGILGNRR